MAVTHPSRNGDTTVVTNAAAAFPAAAQHIAVNNLSPSHAILFCLGTSAENVFISFDGTTTAVTLVPGEHLVLDSIAAPRIWARSAGVTGDVTITTW